MSSIPKLSRTKRLLFVIISCTIYFFFEITIGLKTGSLALIVDAFHQLNDLISYIVALVATRLAMSTKQRPGFTFALKRCEIVGAMFNASILLALALSIFLQSIERFINVPDVDDPFLVFIVGCVGLLLNALCIMLCHDTHTHSHGHSHGPSPHNHAHVNSHDHHHHHHTPDGQNGNFMSLEEEIRAVRIPSLVTQIARPISHFAHDQGQASERSDLRSTQRPNTTRRSAGRFSSWRRSLSFHPQADAELGGPSVSNPQPISEKRKHHSLDPGSPKYVLPDSPRWYDTDQFQPREPSGYGANNGDEADELHSPSPTHNHIDTRAHDHGHIHQHQIHETNNDHEHTGGGHDHTGHNHNHGHSHNLGFAGVFLHLLGDALNNIGVIVAAVIMWQLDSPKRFYADPAVSILIGLIIFGGSLPLTLSSARVLLEAAPKGLDLQKVEEGLVKIPGVASIHCLHIWQLTETDLIASLGVQSEARDLVVWSLVEGQIRRHLALYDINHITVSPQFVQSRSGSTTLDSDVILDYDGDNEHHCTVLAQEQKLQI